MKSGAMVYRCAIRSISTSEFTRDAAGGRDGRADRRHLAPAPGAYAVFMRGQSLMSFR